MYRLASLKREAVTLQSLSSQFHEGGSRGSHEQAGGSGAPGCRLKRANKCGDNLSSVESNSLDLVMKSSPYFCPLCPPGLAYGPSSGSPICNPHEYLTSLVLAVQ